MSTVGALIDRIFREFLHPLDDFPASVPLSALLTDSAATATYDDGYLTVEETDMLDVGGKVQIGRELMLVSAINTTTRTLTFGTSGAFRGALGTTAAEHAQGSLIYLDPPYTRQAVYDGLRGAIPSLAPPLYQVRSIEVWQTILPEEVPVSAFEVIESLYWHNGRWEQGGGATMVNNDPDSSTGVSVQLDPPFASRNLVRYKADFGAITDETTTMASIGITAEMEYPLMLEAVARVMGTVDIKPATQEYISQMLETQGYPPGSGERLRNSLLSYRELLVERVANKLLLRDGMGVETLEAYPGAPT